MNSHVSGVSFALAILGAVGWAVPCPAASGDLNDDGFVDLIDYSFLQVCQSSSGPGTPPSCEDCLAIFDYDEDGDVDITDFATFQNTSGHLPFPLRDYQGNQITLASTAPYSGRQTCGAGDCHDLDIVTNGFLFQMGRTDLEGNVDMRDDYFGNGRFWDKSAARYGVWGHTFV